MDAPRKTLLIKIGDDHHLVNPDFISFVELGEFGGERGVVVHVSCGGTDVRIRLTEKQWQDAANAQNLI